ncbi:DUF4129 domain-containing protein [Kribbella sp. NPDC051620]|uniref:DUF4129 domain-containing protein n=1 Tax=Kribbella sp. NPDC051620 TaxID=3364120 RepID=UPI0037936771
MVASAAGSVRPFDGRKNQWSLGPRPPRNTVDGTVIACWVGLEDAAAAAGVPRNEAETPAEFILRVLVVNGVSAPVLGALADLYREARAALTRLCADLTISSNRRRQPSR